jgi:hypothetical protein
MTCGLSCPKGCLRSDVGITTGTPEIVADLLQCQSRQPWAAKRRKSRKIRDSEADISRPGNKNCGCAHEVAGDNQQERMPAVAYRYTFGVASAF